MQRKYPWHREPYDYDDLKFGIGKPIGITPPPAADLEPNMPKCWDQLDTSSCTAHGIPAAAVSAAIQAQLPVIEPSRLFLYWCERLLENCTKEDAGAYIRDGMKALSKFGYADESLWPFDRTKVLVEPGPEVFAAALQNKIVHYASMTGASIESMKLTISHGRCIVFGFDVYTAFESSEVAKTGILHMPTSRERMLGGHCVALAGYDDDRAAFKVRNSWGADWGLNGYFWMDYEYVLSKLSSDFWVIKM